MKSSLYISLIILSFILQGCNTAKLSTAEEQYSRGEYFAAANTYRRVYNKTSSTKERPLKGRIARQMGICYQQINMAARATAAYKNALRFNNPDSTIYLDMARCQHKEGKFKDAVKSYQTFLEYAPEHRLALNGLRGAQQGAQMKSEKTRYEVRRADLFNSRRADFSPALTKEGDQLYFTTCSEKATGKDKSDITGLKYCDIWFSKKDEKGVWQRPDTIAGSLNTEFDEGTPAFSPDGNTMYFTKARRDAVSPCATEIWSAARSSGQWGAPSKLEITKDTLSLYAHPAVSPDGLWLYFVSDMPGGLGGKDIWRAPLNKEGIGPVENLGEQINTSGNEMFPTFRSNGMMYFSSDGQPGLGGLDIFSARQDEWGIWHTQNLGYPVNSNFDDFSMTFFEKEEQEGFFSSNRGDARGYDHLFSFRLPSIKVLITGIVTDRDEEPIANAIVRVVGRDGSNHKIIAKNDGTFQVSIDRDIEYVMMAGCKGFLYDKEEFKSDSAEEDATYEVNFVLASINKPVLIDNIFYEFNKAALSDSSAVALNELVTLLNDNPTVAIELGAHTDMKGSEQYNEALSLRRAQSVIDYLVKAGIEAARLTPKGYGESSPKTVTEKIHAKYDYLPVEQVLDETFILTLTDEQQEVANQINRRTEFQVTDIYYGLH